MIIWSSNSILPDKLYDSLIKTIKDNHIIKNEFYSSFFRHGDVELLRPYYNNVIKNMMIDLGLDNLSKYQFQFWTQMSNSETDSHLPHAHFTGLESISWVHFVQVPTQKCFYFLDSNDKKIYPKQNNGDIIAWPSFLVHGVDKVEEDNFDRIVVSGNINFIEYCDNGKKIISEEYKNKHSNLIMWKTGKYTEQMEDFFSNVNTLINKSLL